MFLNSNSHFSSPSKQSRYRPLLSNRNIFKKNSLASGFTYPDGLWGVAYSSLGHTGVQPMDELLTTQGVELI